MRATMSLSNVQYSALKHQSGLHNWGFISHKGQFDFDMDELDALLDGMILLEDLEPEEATP
jgi:hypothetical protein